MKKHFTLNRANKGTDHSFSLEPQGLEKFIRNLKRVELLMGNDEKRLLKSEKKPLYKMKKSIVASKNLIAGSKITFKDLDFKSPGGGLEPFEYNRLIGKKLRKNIKKEQPIFFKNVK